MKYLFTCFLLLIYGLSSAQVADLKFRHLDISKGLPSDQVSAIVKDKSGYIWIGTNEGLARYDGRAIKVYRNIPSDTNSLPDNFITSIVMSNDGRMFIGTSKGVYEYIFRRNIFTRLREPNEKQGKERIRKIFLLDSKDNLWVFESGMPLLLYNIETRQSRTLDFYLNENELKMYNINEGRNGHYWISCATKLFEYDINNNTHKTFHHPFNLPGNPNAITSCYETADQKLWCTTLNTGLVHFDPATGVAKKYLYKNNKEDNVTDCINLLPANAISRSALWLATPTALCAFDTGQKKYTIYQQDVYNPFSCKINFTQRYFLGLYYDTSQNVLWYYGSNGIDICSFDDQYLQSYYSISEQQKIPFSEVRAFIQDPNDPDRYYIGCANSKSLYIYNEKKRTLSTKELNLQDKGVNAMLLMPDHKIWLASSNNIYEWIPGKNSLKDISYYFIDPKCNCKSSKLSLFKDSYNGVWIGTKGQGLCRYDTHTHTATWYNQYHEDAGGATMNFIPGFAQANGHVYAIEYTNGLYEFDSAGKLLQHFIADKISNHAITTGIKSYFDISTGKDNKLWMTSYQGILQFDIGKSNFSLYNEQDKLPYGATNKITEDNKGIVWVDYRSSLVAFDPLTKKVRVFNYLNGYTGAQDGTCLLVNNAGNIRAAYSDHLESIDTDPFKETGIALPQVLITSIKIGDAFIQPSDTSSAILHLQVYPKQNEFVIDFALPLFTDMNGFVYYYKLDGYDREWINAEQLTSVKYANLRGEDYTFSVKAINTLTGQSTAITTIKITVHPPYYRTWWFILLCIIFTASLLYCIYRYRLHQLLQLEKIRSGISSDLHDEVGATLSSISIYSNIAQKLSETDIERSKDYLFKIENNSREMIEKMGDIVWSINPDNDSVEKVISRMHSYAYELLGAKNVRLTWDQQPDIVHQKLNMDQRKNLYLFFKEVINNTAKYAAAEDVHISLGKEQHIIKLTVSDNGIGFDMATTQQGNGLQNMQQRAALLKGKCIIESAKDKGTSVSLSFPL